ncbi:MAG: transcriptional regulator TbsP [Haloarculaceae archaeon]
MGSNLLEDDIEAVLTETLSEAGETVYAVNPDRSVIEDIVEQMTHEEETASVRLLADERLIKDVMNDFLVASKAADLVDAGRLEMRVLEDAPNHSLLVTDATVVSLVEAGGRVAGLTADDAEFVGDVRAAYADTWDHSDEYSLRTPPLTKVQTTLESDIGPDAATDFDDVLTSLGTARGDGDGLDEVTISLLVAARNEELLYDISKWGEDIGLASKATFSRTKTTLEEMGLIETEKVPIDVGRPRLRLMLGDDRLADTDIDELAGVAQGLLAA